MNQREPGGDGLGSPRMAGLRRGLTRAAPLGVAMAAAVGAAAASASGASAGRVAHRVTASPASSKATFAYLQTDGAISYFVFEADGAKAEAKKLGITVHIENENSSNSTTVSDVQQALADGDKGLIVVAPSEQVGPRLVQLAQKSKVPIMASDNGFAGPSGKQVPFVGINAAQFGASAGAILMSEYKKLKFPVSSTYMLLVTNPSLQTIQQRTNAEQAKAIAAGFPKSHIIDVPTTDNTTAQAYNATGPIKTAHPEAQYWLITGGNDDVAFGAAKALVAAGVSPSHIDAVGMGGDISCSIWAKGAPDVGFRGTNYLYPNAIGAAAVKEMYDSALRHKPFPANTYVAPIPMTKATLHKVDAACK